MGTKSAFGIGIALIVFVATASSVAFKAYNSPTKIDRPLAATLLLEVPDGHGSGVYLGNGYVLTVNHVVEGQKSVASKTRDGKSFDGAVLWGNPDLDVALVRAPIGAAIPSAPLVCRDAAPGDPIRIIGNPSILKFVSSYGRISSEIMDLPNAPKRQIIDGTVTHGNSGGLFTTPLEML